MSEAELTPEEEGALLRALLGRRNKTMFAMQANIPGGASMVSQHLSGHRPIGLGAAAAYSRGLGVPVEAFSPRLAKLIAQAQPDPSLPCVPSPSPAPGEPVIKVPVLANAGSMGGGIDALHEDVMVGALTLSENWVTKYVRPTRRDALRFIHGFGDSMSPTFEDGDVLLVDTGVRDPQAIDGVYVLAANSRLYIKRVRCRMDGVMEVSSDNATVKTVDVLDGNNAINVLGRVVWCWNGKKL